MLSERSINAAESPTEQCLIEPQGSKWSRFNPVSAYLRFRRAKLLTVEPVIFLFMFSVIMNLSVGQQYLFNRFGREMFAERLNYTGSFNFCMSTDVLNEEIGNDTKSHQKAGDVVQTETAVLSLAASLLGQLPSIFAALLFGPISDRIGRKSIMLILSTSATITGLLSVLLVHFNWSLYWILPLSFINALAGGIPGMLTVIYSYIADVSSHKWLTLRLGIVESMIFFGTTLGVVTGGQWLEGTNCKFEGPYILYCAGNFAIILYVIFLLPESLTSEERKQRMADKNQSGLQHVARGFKIFFRKNDYSRWRIWSAAIIMFILYLVITGDGDISTLFLLHAPLKWTPGYIAIFQAINQLTVGVAIFTIIPILVVLRFPDPLILTVGMLWGSLFTFLTGFVRKDWQMWTVGVLSGVAGIGAPPIRSTISKAISADDQGAAFSILATFQVLASAVASVVFYFFYPFTLYLGWSANTTYFLLAFFFILPLPFAIALLLFHKRPGAVYWNKDKEQNINSQGGSYDTEGDKEQEETAALLSGESGEFMHSQRDHYGSRERERDLHELSSPEFSSGYAVEKESQQVKL